MKKIKACNLIYFNLVIILKLVRFNFAKTKAIESWKFWKMIKHSVNINSLLVNKLSTKQSARGLHNYLEFREIRQWTSSNLMKRIGNDSIIFRIISCSIIITKLLIRNATIAIKPLMTISIVHCWLISQIWNHW